MSDNDLSSKLAKGMRRAKDPAAPSGAVTPAAPTSNKPSTSVADQGHPKGRPRSQPAAGRFAEQNDQAPPASLDRPWENLHPKRIWPD
mgnify:CR=1 FL=1